MDQSILAKRRLDARNRMIASLQELAGHGQLPPEEAQRVATAGYPHDVMIDALYKEEALAEALEALASGGPAAPGRQEMADTILQEVEGLTKTSQEAIRGWADAEEVIQ